MAEAPTAPAAEDPTSGRRGGRAIAPNGTAQDGGAHDGALAHDGGAHEGSSPPLRGEEAAELAEARAAALADFRVRERFAHHDASERFAHHDASERFAHHDASERFAHHDASERFARAQSQSKRGAPAVQGSSRYDLPPERLPNDETQLANNSGTVMGAADGPAAASQVDVALDADVAAAHADGALTPLRRNSSSVPFDLSRVGSSGGLRLQGGALVDEVENVSDGGVYAPSALNGSSLNGSGLNSSSSLPSASPSAAAAAASAASSDQEVPRKSLLSSFQCVNTV